MSRFQLNPKETAMENLFRAATQATLFLLKQHGFYGLVGYDRKTLIDDCILHGVRHFIEFKVMKHTYNRKYPFMNNVMSSVWSVQGNIANKLVKDMVTRYHMNDIASVDFAISTQDGLPLYLSYEETFHRKKKRAKFKDMRPVDKARVVRELYEDYVAEAKEMDLSEILDFGPWLSRCGYSADPELMLALEPKAIRRQMVSEHAKILKESELTESERHTREYMREWQRRYRQKKLLEQSAEFEKLYGKPPPGYAWKERKGVVGLQKLKEEPHEDGI
jgi:hypothetical protein